MYSRTIHGSIRRSCFTPRKITNRILAHQHPEVTMHSVVEVWLWSELYDDVIEKYDSVTNEIVSPEHKTCKTCNGLRRDSGTEIKRSDVAILVADVVDYCRLIEIDDLKTVLHLERLKRDVIAPIAWREGANIIRSFGGDGLVLSFADPLMAVRCAKKIQDKGSCIRKAMVNR